MSKIKPCPSCKEEAPLLNLESSRPSQRWSRTCKCGFSIRGDNPNEVDMKWNAADRIKRTDTPMFPDVDDIPYQ
jgi:hypothetical protein